MTLVLAITTGVFVGYHLAILMTWLDKRGAERQWKKNEDALREEYLQDMVAPALRRRHGDD